MSYTLPTWAFRSSLTLDLHFFLSRLTLLFNPDNVPAAPSLPTGWTAGSCMTEGTNVRALSGASTSSSTMTIER